jgi:TATA-binding protein-associated factor
MVIQASQCQSVNHEQELREKLLPMLLPAIYNGLQDQDDDVRAVAAASLLPATETLVTSLSNHVSFSFFFSWHCINSIPYSSTP